MKIKAIVCAFILIPALSSGQWTLNHTFPSTPLNLEVVDSTIYVVTGLNGLYVSYDNGQSWLQKNNNISDTLIRAFYADSSILMAPVGGNGGGINISHDGGNTWSVSSTGIIYPAGIYSVSKSGTNLLCGTFGTFAGDSAVLYLSANNGLSWTPQVTISWTSGFPAFAVKDSFVVASSYSGEFYYSTDYGVNYTSVSTPFTAEDMVITNSAIVAAASDGNSSIKYSTNNGFSWLTGEDTISAHDFKHTNDTVYAATLKGFRYSFDAGMNWFEYNAGLPSSKQCYAVGVKGNDLWLGHQSGQLYKLSLSQILLLNEHQSTVHPYTIFPNPADDAFTISTGLSPHRDVTIILQNILGEKIKLIESTFKPGNNSIIDCNDLSSGIYFIEIIREESRHVEKVIINH